MSSAGETDPDLQANDQQQQQQQQAPQQLQHRHGRLGGGGGGAVTGDLTQDRVKLIACGAILVLHGAALTALDVIMMRRRCSGLLGGAFAVLAASVAALLSSLLLSVYRRAGSGVVETSSGGTEANGGGGGEFSRRGVAGVALMWAATLAGDACWLGLTLSRLGSPCLGTAMIGATAVGLVACPASLVAFVILFGWFGQKE